MPTYVCSVPPGLMTPAAKAGLAQAISRLHHEATGAPRFFVQVVIEESVGTSRFLGGAPADGHIWIRGDIRAGRPEAVREALMLAIMRETAVITGVAQTDIWVYLCNFAPTDMVEYGHVLPAPGEEQAWFAALPSDLRAYLAGLGTNASGFTL